jgi:hypothetical protein
MKKGLMVKRNINTLDKPLWTPSRKWAGELEFEDSKGYIISAKSGIPTDKDMEILNHILALAQQSEEYTLSFNSMSSLLQELELDNSQKEYERVIRSLTKWSEIQLFFPKGTFYESNKKIPSFSLMSVLTFLKIDKGKVEIDFNKRFIELNESNFCKFISIDFMKSIESPYAKRLYEILCKGFFGREVWSIGEVKLSEKMVVYYRYPAELTKIVIKAVEEINLKLKNSGSNTSYKVSKKIGVFTFTKEG